MPGWMLILPPLATQRYGAEERCGRPDVRPCGMPCAAAAANPWVKVGRKTCKKHPKHLLDTQPSQDTSGAIPAGQTIFAIAIPNFLCSSSVVLNVSCMSSHINTYIIYVPKYL